MVVAFSLALVAVAPPAAASATDAEVLVATASGKTKVLAVPSGTSVGSFLRELRARPGVRWAARNHGARAASASLTPAEPEARGTSAEVFPDDPGPSGEPGGWMQVQWNLRAGAGGVDALGAWENLRERHPRRRPGGGVVVAVVDSGVAFRDHGRHYRRNPDMRRKGFVRGRDFVNPGSPPLDRTGHGTHVAATIAQATNNGFGLAGLAWGARIMPVRALDARDRGTAESVARSIRWAARRGADVINLSLGFGPRVNTCRQLPGVCRAVRFAHRRGAVLVAAAGNGRSTELPARLGRVIAVGASTSRGCTSRRSPREGRVDLLAPGGGGAIRCPRTGQARITQFSLDPSRARNERRYDRFTYVSSIGTTSAAPHVAAGAAMLISSGALGPGAGPRAIKQALESSATEPPGAKERPQQLGGSPRGAGVLDLAAATS